MVLDEDTVINNIYDFYQRDKHPLLRFRDYFFKKSNFEKKVSIINFFKEYNHEQGNFNSFQEYMDYHNMRNKLSYCITEDKLDTIFPNQEKNLEELISFIDEYPKIENSKNINFSLNEDIDFLKEKNLIKNVLQVNKVNWHYKNLYSKMKPIFIYLHLNKEEFKSYNSLNNYFSMENQDFRRNSHIHYEFYTFLKTIQTHFDKDEIIYKINDNSLYLKYELKHNQLNPILKEVLFYKFKKIPLRKQKIIDKENKSYDFRIELK